MSQETDILKWFKKRSRRSMATPWEIQKWVLPDDPITSVRRAMTEMTEARLLRKTGYSRPGPKGAWCRCWALTPKGRNT